MMMWTSPLLLVILPLIKKMVEDTALQYIDTEISKAGAFSYLSSGGFLDHSSLK
jgi:hypothetical protein